MLNRRRLFLSAALVAAVVVPLAATGAVRAMSASGHAGFLDHVASKLSLTAAQKTQVSDILKAHESELTDGMTAVKNAHAAMFEAIHAQPASDDAIRTAAAGLGKAEGDLAVTHAHMLAEVRPLLTPDQQQKLQEMIGSHAEMASGHMKHHCEGAFGG